MSASYDTKTGLPIFYRWNSEVQDEPVEVPAVVPDSASAPQIATIAMYTGRDFGIGNNPHSGARESTFLSWDEAYKHALETKKMMITKCAKGKGTYYVKYVQGETGNEAKGSQKHIIENWEYKRDSGKQLSDEHLTYLITHH